MSMLLTFSPREKANMPDSVTLTMKSNLPHVSHGNIALYEASP